MSSSKTLKKEFTFRFYAELNDFLPDERKQIAFEYNFKTPITVFDTLISFRIPISEVDLVLVNGEPAELTHKLHEEDYISVFPVFESLDVSSGTNIHEGAARHTGFILDCHLGKLAKYLRMLGFDTLYNNHYEDDLIIAKAQEEERIILTRDRLLLRSVQVTRGYYVRETDKHMQLKEVIEKFDLYSQFRPFSRCMVCNHLFLQVDKSEIIHLLKEEIARDFDQFYYCPQCKKAFWKGSHYDRMLSFMNNLKNK